MGYLCNVGLYGLPGGSNAFNTRVVAEDCVRAYWNADFNVKLKIITLYPVRIRNLLPTLLIGYLQNAALSLAYTFVRDFQPHLPYIIYSCEHILAQKL